MKTYKITLKPIPNSPGGMLSERILTKCTFCYKTCHIDSNLFANLHWLAGKEKFFCGFCIRNNFDTKANKDVLVLTFKNVFNYFYQQNHLNKKKMWMCEIKDIIEDHRNVGLRNPVFYYDEESMNWFVNFSRVGSVKRKMSLEGVKKTIYEIVDSLKIGVYTKGVEEKVIRRKYLDAIDLFDEKRYRPKGRKVLSPTIGEIRKDIGAL